MTGPGGGEWPEKAAKGFRIVVQRRRYPKVSGARLLMRLK